MFSLLRRKIYRPKIFSNDPGTYTYKSEESIDTMSSSREDVMTPNTHDLLNGCDSDHRQEDISSSDSRSNSHVEVDLMILEDPNYAELIDRKSNSSSPEKAGSIYENESNSPQLDDIIAELQNVGNINYISSANDITLDVNENNLVNQSNTNHDNIGVELDLDSQSSPDPLYSVVKKPKHKKKPISNKTLIEEMDALFNDNEQKDFLNGNEIKNVNNNNLQDISEAKERNDLTALLDSIVSEMDIFVSEGSDESNEELKSYNTEKDTSMTNSLPMRGNAARKKHITDQMENNLDRPSKYKYESTPNLSQNDRYLNRNPEIAKATGSDYELNNETTFEPMDPQKKSVSFNDVVLEFERPRSIYSQGSSDDCLSRDYDQTDVKKKAPDDVADIISPDYVYGHVDKHSKSSDEYEDANRLRNSSDMYSNQERLRSSSDVYAYQYGLRSPIDVYDHQGRFRSSNDGYGHVGRFRSSSDDVAYQDSLRRSSYIYGYGTQPRQSNDRYSHGNRTRSPNNAYASVDRLRSPNYAYASVDRLRSPNNAYASVDRLRSPNNAYAYADRLRRTSDAYVHADRLRSPSDAYAHADRLRSPSDDNAHRDKVRSSSYINRPGNSLRSSSASFKPGNRTRNPKDVYSHVDRIRGPRSEDRRRGHVDRHRSPSVMSYDCASGKVYAEKADSEVVAILTDKSRGLDYSSGAALVVSSGGNVCSDTEDEKTDSDDDEDYEPVKVRRFRKTRTILLHIAWFLLGMSTVLPGTVLPYLAEHIGVTWEPVSRGFFSKGGGYVIGCIIALLFLGVCRINTELVILISLFAGAVGISTVPWFPNLLIFCGSNAAEGLARGLFQIGSHMYLKKVWDEPTGIELVHTLYIVLAAGAALIPQISRPFTQSEIADDLYEYIEGSGIENILRLNGYNVVLNGSHTILIKDSGQPVVPNTAGYPVANTTSDYENVSILQRMCILYFIVAVLTLLCGLVFLGFLTYTCVQSCRKNVKQYNFDRKTEKINNLKEKIAKSRESLSSFDHIVVANGKPGTNGKTGTNGKPGTNGKTGSNGKTDETASKNGKSNGENDSNHLNLEAESVVKNSETNEELHSNDGSDTKVKLNGKSLGNGNANVALSEGGSNNQLNHVVHVTPAKRKVSFKISFLEKKKSVKKGKKKKKDSLFLRNKGCSTSTLMYTYVFFCLPIAEEIVFSYYIYLFTMNSPLQLTEIEASLLLSMFWCCIFLSRIIAIPLSKICPPNAIMICCLMMKVMATSVIAAYGWQFQRLLWAFTALFGFFLGPILPGGFTWANIYLKHNVKCLALAYCSAAIGMALFSWMGGMIIQYCNYRAVMYLLIGISSLSFMLFLPTLPFLKAGKVFKAKAKKGKENVVSTPQATYV